MKRYIRFENGRQVEVTVLTEKPKGTGWFEAPKSFDSSKRYRLSNGKIEEIPVSELENDKFNFQKTSALEELKRIIDSKRSRYVGVSEAKRKCYEIQEKAANAVINGQGQSHELLIKPLADVRNISVLEMAELILEKTMISNRKIIEAEALEDEYQFLIVNASSTADIDELLVEVAAKLEGF